MVNVAEFVNSREIKAYCPTHGDYVGAEFFMLGEWRPSPCPTCQQAEMKRQNQQWWRDQQEIARKAKQNRIAKQLEEIGAQSGIPARYEGKGFDQYRVDSPAQEHALNACRSFAENLKNKTGHNLALVGSMGTGKTHLACAIARHALDNGMAAVYTTVGRMVLSVNDTYKPGSDKSESDVLKPYLDSDLLVMDELGRDRGSAHEQRLLFAILDHRCAELRPTVLVTNLLYRSHAGTPGLDQVIGSFAMDRLGEGTTAIPMQWESGRGKY